jgi:signal transduction histidine kinase
MNKDRLAMALTHVIRNAQDATPIDGSIKLRIMADANSARIEVADSGAGMTAEFVRDRLFRPFDSTKGAQGMGIGAYQVRETVRAAGGDVEVETELGSGTKIRLRLPLAESVPTSRAADLPVA